MGQTNLSRSLTTFTFLATSDCNYNLPKNLHWNWLPNIYFLFLLFYGSKCSITWHSLALHQKKFNKSFKFRELHFHLPPSLTKTANQILASRRLPFSAWWGFGAQFYLFLTECNHWNNVQFKVQHRRNLRFPNANQSRSHTVTCDLDISKTFYEGSECSGCEINSCKAPNAGMYSAKLTGQCMYQNLLC